MKTYLLLPRMQIQNANAMSSTCTIGFPAMTAWLGAVHAMERKVQAAGLSSVRCAGVAVACHTCALQVYRGPRDYRNSIIGTANPLRKKGASFERPPFIEEPRIHLTVSVLIEVEGLKGPDAETFQTVIARWLPASRWAGGDLLRYGKPVLLPVRDGDELEERAVLRRLMPGYVLIERRDLMEPAMRGGEEGLDVLLRHLAIRHSARLDEEGRVIGWDAMRETPGWIVPIAAGFKGLSPLGHAACQRDPATPHRFVEPVLTLGEFRLPCRFRHIKEILWHYEYQEDSALYLCGNQKTEEE